MMIPERDPIWMVPIQIKMLKYIRRTRVLNPWAPAAFKSKPTWRAHKIKYRSRLRVSLPNKTSPIRYRPGKTQADA